MKKNDGRERLLGAETSGRRDIHADVNRHPYEATGYDVLDIILQSGHISESDSLVDYGCGKGRVVLYVAANAGCRCAGVEFDEELCRIAQENLAATKTEGAVFVNCDATEFVPEDENVFFFFNPFSEKIFVSVLNRIIVSFYENPRRIKLLFYYPDDAYGAVLRNTDEAVFSESLICPGYAKDRRERVDVYTMG